MIRWPGVFGNYSSGGRALKTNCPEIQTTIKIILLCLLIAGSVAIVSADGNNVLTGNTASGNGNGIVLINSDNNNLVGNNANGNANSGIMLEGSDNNTITGNTASGNSYGVLVVDSENNTISGNTITGNTISGIGLILLSRNNLIYNNYFNNINNVRVDSSVNGTVWSIVPVPGKNIIGGVNTGGNFWANPDNTGWSQTHPDSGGGFTVPYNVTTDRLTIDVYPLAMFNNGIAYAT